jgi:ABC-2 type transport system ATP-binding protein
VFGASVTQQNEQVRTLVGLAPSDPGVYPDLTCAEYLTFFAQCHHVPKAQQAGLVNDLLQLVDLHHRRDTTTDLLTPGMRKRLGLARALVHDPRLLIMDDFSSWLDPRARADIRDMIVNLSGMGKMVLLSARAIADVRDVCTNAIVLAAGRVTDVTARVPDRDPRAQRRIVVRYLGDVTAADTLAAAGRDVISIQQMQSPLPPDAQQTPLNQLKEMRITFAGGYLEASELLRSLMHSGVQVVGFNEEYAE